MFLSVYYRYNGAVPAGRQEVASFCDAYLHAVAFETKRAQGGFQMSVHLEAVSSAVSHDYLIEKIRNGKGRLSLFCPHVQIVERNVSVGVV